MRLKESPIKFLKGPQSEATPLLNTLLFSIQRIAVWNFGGKSQMKATVLLNTNSRPVCCPIECDANRTLWISDGTISDGIVVNLKVNELHAVTRCGLKFSANVSTEPHRSPLQLNQTASDRPLQALLVDTSLDYWTTL